MKSKRLATTMMAILAISFIFVSTTSFSSAAQTNNQSSSNHLSLNPISRIDMCPTASCSSNWAGYTVSGPTGSVTDAKASWTVPAVSCPKRGSSYAAFWVGIDGLTSNTVEQTGVQAQCNRGAASYSAWYEFYPNPSITIASISVKPGDNFYADVSYSSGTFTVTLTDLTTTATFTTSSSVPSAQESSAEWIAEAPSSCIVKCSVLPLANFGTSNFGQEYTQVTGTGYATVGGVTGAIGSFSTFQAITMTTSTGTVKALPSILSTDGTSFTVTWYHS